MNKLNADFRVVSVSLDYENKWCIQAYADGDSYYISLKVKENPNLKIGDRINGAFQHISNKHPNIPLDERKSPYDASRK